MRYKRAHIEISNICNVQCSFCPVVSRPKTVLLPDRFEYILSQVAPIAEDVCLHLLGEPLAHPDFEDLIKLCEKYKVQVQLTTNALLIEKYHETLINSTALRQINFSLQVFKDNFPERDPFPYLQSIFMFSRDAMERNENIYINYRLWDTGTNDNEDYLTMIEKEFSVSIKRAVDVAGIKSKNVTGKLYLHFDSRFEWPSPLFPKRSDQGKCYGLVNHFGIHADGTVVPCCLDKDAVIDLGNVFEESLESILNSTRANSIRDGFNNGRLVEDLCQRCTFIKRFDKNKLKRAQLA